MVIPELIRLLMERGIRMGDAIDIVSKTCAYTNHTILAEALEKWPMDYLNQAVPQLMPIIRELDTIVKDKFQDKSVAIIDDSNRVHMAHMDIHYGYSVNGVAYLLFDVQELFQYRLVVCKCQKLLQFLCIFMPACSDDLIQIAAQPFVAVHQPAAEGNSVGLIIEFLRINPIEMIQFVFL